MNHGQDSPAAVLEAPMAAATGDPILDAQIAAEQKALAEAEWKKRAAKVVERVNKAQSRFSARRSGLDAMWFRNFLFQAGIQWLTFDTTRKDFRPSRLKKWVYRSVTNFTASTWARLESLFSTVYPNWEFTPATDAVEDITSAKVAADLENILALENRIDRRKSEMSAWLVGTGNVFLLSGSHKEKNFTEVLSPFQVLADLSISALEDQPIIIISDYKDKEYVEDLYGEGSFSTSGGVGVAGVKYLSRLGSLHNGGIESDVFGGGSGGHPDGVALVRRVFIRDTENEEGVYAVLIGDEVVELEPLMQDREGRGVIPIQHIKFDAVAGAFFGRTPISDLISKQEALNRFDSTIYLICTRMSIPGWVMPIGTVIEGDRGEPGFEARYHSVASNGQAPAQIQGVQVPASLIQWRQRMVDDIQELSSMADVLQGKTPYAGAPAALAENLTQAALGRFGGPFGNVSEGWRGWMCDQLLIYQVYPHGQSFVHAIGASATWKLKAFKEADFSGGVNVRVETDTAAPRSPSVDSTKIQAAINAGLLDLMDPVVRADALKRMGIGQLIGDTSSSEVYASLIINQMKQTGQMIPARAFVDNHDVFLRLLRRELMDLDLDPNVANILMQSAADHSMIKNAEMTPATGAAPGGPMGPGQQGPPGGVGQADGQTLTQTGG